MVSEVSKTVVDPSSSELKGVGNNHYILKGVRASVAHLVIR